MNEQMSYHVRVDRAERVKHIVEDIGMGQIIKEKYVRFNLGQAGRWVCLTDTGITVVKTEDKLKIITMYVTTKKELLAVYGGQKKIPQFLQKRVDRNQSKYIKGGKTIWTK